LKFRFYEAVELETCPVYWIR